MSELEKILNDDLLKCEIVESAENAARRVDLIKWTHDGLFSVADLRKDTGKLEISEVPERRTSLKRTSISTKPIGVSLFLPKNPHDNVGNNYEPKTIRLWNQGLMQQGNYFHSTTVWR